MDLIKRVLANECEVEAFEDARKAESRLGAGEAYEAVLCGLDDQAAAMRVFRRAREFSSAVRLVPIAGDQNQASQFREAWNSGDEPEKPAGKMGLEWLPERCTVRDILALSPARAQGPSKQAEDDQVERVETKTIAGGNPTAERTRQRGKGKGGEEPISTARGEAGADEDQDGTKTHMRGPGMVIDGYRLICLIGRGEGQGGSATTWMCINETTEQRAAIKFVGGEGRVAQELAALRKYVNAAQGSEHLMQVEHINSDDSGLWFVTPLADSMTGGYTADAYRPLTVANQLQAKGHLAELEAVRVGLGVARALQVLNHAGFVHGDLGPGNILSLRRGWVLADPGLVRFLGEHRLCRNKEYYPDLKGSRPCDDLYALGLILWEMVSGIAEIASGRDRLRLDGKMLSLLLQTNLPFAKLICHAAAENQDQRYMNAEEMLHDLESVAKTLVRRAGLQHSLYNLPKLRSLRTSFGLPHLA